VGQGFKLLACKNTRRSFQDIKVNEVTSKVNWE
jgi:hypothetical protein